MKKFLKFTNFGQIQIVCTDYIYVIRKFNIKEDVNLQFTGNSFTYDGNTYAYQNSNITINGELDVPGRVTMHYKALTEYRKQYTNEMIEKYKCINYTIFLMINGDTKILHADETPFMLNATLQEL